nr:Chain B, H3 histone2H9M_D Chain D, H3 histone3ASL_B Chain B, Histone H3.3 [Homo sapiens]
ARTKQTARKST